MRSKILKISALLLIITACIGLCSCIEEDRTELFEMVSGLADSEILVSFPGLGIKAFVINTVAFSIPVGQSNIVIPWGGLLMTLGAVCTIVYFCLRARRTVKSDHLFDLVVWPLIGGVLGARLLYILTTLERYKELNDIFVGNVGLSLLGGLIGGAIALALTCKLKRLKFKRVADIAVPAVMLGQIIGRFADLLNGASYGYELGKNEFLYFARMGIAPHTAEGISASAGMPAYVHPAFLYEAVWNIVGLAIMQLVFRKKHADGQKLYFYMAWYGFGRMLIEMIRTDSLYVGSIRIGVIIGCLAFIAGIAMLILGAEHGKKKREAGEEYEKVYTNFTTGNPITSKYNEDEENEDEDN